MTMTSRAGVLGGAAFVLGLAWASPAFAQIDVNPPLPTVMLLVDSSGSMEDKADGTPVVTCNPDPDVVSDVSKWQTLVTVLTGSVPNMGCYADNRSSSDFVNEFSINSTQPYDAYWTRQAFHRIVSNDCVVGPGTPGIWLPADPYLWPANPIGYHQYNSYTNACDPDDWQQNGDGILDAYKDTVRFGLMTFDNDTRGATGLNGLTYDAPGGFAGQWSYYNNWNSGGSPNIGHPPGCNQAIYEVGARNPIAPPWEGRLISPGAPSATLSDIQTTNDAIQAALLGMRPYGATPMAGMMADASTFFLYDHQANGALTYYTEYDDPYFNGGCRPSYLIVLSDGAPNQDMKPYCQQQGGSCPYLDPWTYAYQLANPANPKLAIKTFTIGFGISNINPNGNGPGNFDCTTLNMPSDFSPGGKCTGATGLLAACCTLDYMAFEGGTQRAYYANNITDLKNALSNILSQVAAGATSRTTPVFGVTSGFNPAASNAPAVGWQFTSAFTPANGQLWNGHLDRHRWQCNSVNGTLTPQLQDVDPSKGDDFAADINKGKATRQRLFYVDISSQDQDSWDTIRPYLTTDDGIGLNQGQVYSGSNTTIAGTMQTYPRAMDMQPMPAQCNALSLTIPPQGAKSPGQCAYMVMNWLLGGNNGGQYPTRSGNEFGAIYHGTPALSTPPVAHVRDEDYSVFSTKWATRPVVLYTATTDGQIHAHKVMADSSNDNLLADMLQNNELWSWIPPRVMPNILGDYPNTPGSLLDGSPVVRDIPFERSFTQAEAGGTGAGATWKTALLVGGGYAGGFYEALDVTDPTNPIFLWQLAKVNKGGKKGRPKGANCNNGKGKGGGNGNGNGNNGNGNGNGGNNGQCKGGGGGGGNFTALFGDTVPAPGIASIALLSQGTVKETAVALLSGGTGTLATPLATCPVPKMDMSELSGGYVPRKTVRCWLSDQSMNLYVVRIKDGQLLRVFTPNVNLVPKEIDGSLITIVPFDAPLTGAPVAYPGLPGQVSNRVYVGNAEGQLYRLDLSDPNPTNWTGTMVFDAFSVPGDLPTDSQPIQGWPTTAVDEIGNAVIIFSTGDQNVLTSNLGEKNRIWSITESAKPSGSYKFSISPNWFEPYPGAAPNETDGTRVTGPISIFDGAAYFATYSPASPTNGLACANGYGTIWGVTYKQSQDVGGGPRPLGRLPQGANNYVTHIDQLSGSVIFGVAVTMQPSCYSSSSTTDDYVGMHTGITGGAMPTYSLLYHTGNSGNVYGGAKAAIRAATMGLASPRQYLRFDSWASVAE